MSLGFGEPGIDTLDVIGVVAREDAQFILLLVFVETNGADVVRIAFGELFDGNLF